MTPGAMWIEYDMTQPTKLIRRRPDPVEATEPSEFPGEWESYVARFAYPARREVRRLMRSSTRLVDLSVGTPVDPVDPLIRSALTSVAEVPGYPATHGTPELRASSIDLKSFGTCQ